MTTCKECISRIRTKAEDITMLGFFYCRLNDLFFFFPDQPFITGMRIQPQDGDPWLVDIEISFQ
jgi:hypothetical protein